MRATLEQLKAMDDNELFRHWGTDKFPFDQPIGCFRCLTMHGRRYTGDCHPQLKAEILNLSPTGLFVGDDIPLLRSHLEALYALRLFYDSLYPQTESPEVVVESVAEVAPVQP